MKILIPALIDRIEDEDIKAFAFRFYNTLKMVVIPLVLLYVVEDINIAVQSGDFSSLFSLEFWPSTVFGALVAVFLSLLTGTEKVIRKISMMQNNENLTEE